MRLRPLFGKLALSVASLGLSAAALEIGARLLVSRWSQRMITPYGSVSRFHPVLGWDKPPGARVQMQRPEYASLLEINNKGLRGPERDYPKPPGTRRVLMLGDSFAEGYTVEEALSVRALLERGLESGGCGPTEVLNGGTAVWSTDQEYLFYMLEGRRYAPDVVILFFFYNDLYYNTTDVAFGGRTKPVFALVDGQLVLQGTPIPAPPESERVSRMEPRPFRLKPWKGSFALRLLSNRLAAGAPDVHLFLSRFGIVEPPPRFEPPAEDMAPFGPGGPRVNDMWRRTEAILAALKSAVEADGGRLVLLYVPDRFEVNEKAWALTRRQYRLGRKWDPDRLPARLAEVAARQGIEMIDPRAELREAEGSWSRAYLPQDGHWNETGNAVVARKALPVLSRTLGCP